MVLTHPWTRLDLYLGGWVGIQILCAVPVRILKAVMMGSRSVVTKYGGVFDLMNINELSLSVTATVGRPLGRRADTDRLLTSDITPSGVTRTFMSNVPLTLPCLYPVFIYSHEFNWLDFH